jgi:hypothetical protein
MRPELCAARRKKRVFALSIKGFAIPAGGSQIPAGLNRLLNFSRAAQIDSAAAAQTGFASPPVSAIVARQRQRTAAVPC